MCWCVLYYMCNDNEKTENNINMHQEGGHDLRKPRRRVSGSYQYTLYRITINTITHKQNVTSYNL